MALILRSTRDSIDRVVLYVASRLAKPSFFFSSRRRHTRGTGDWSSDVCSSDLMLLMRCKTTSRLLCADNLARKLCLEIGRSEERRVGKECRSRWSAYH